MSNNSQELQNRNIDNNYIEEDEIDLKELFNTIMRYKYKIAIFSFLVSIATLVYVLSIPNSYKSQVILAPQGDSKSSGAGGLASLASLAGVSLGGSSGKDPFTMMETTLKDYEFNKSIIEKYNLIEKFENPQNLVFAMGIETFYSKPEKSNESDLDEKVFETNKSLASTLSISTDKASGLITLSAEHPDRFFAKELTDIYLEELVNKIKLQDMKEIDKQIEYYNKELNTSYDVSLKEQLSTSLSSLMQKRVFSLANDYYFVSKLTDSRVAYIKEKTKPKRALILVVSIITSLILGIFMAFFLEFLKSNKTDEKE